MTVDAIPDGTGLSRGAIAGIVVGVVVVAVIIFSGILFKFVRSSRSNLPFNRSTNYRI